MDYILIRMYWPEYFKTMGCIVLVYWAIVAAIYFRQEITNLLRLRRIGPGKQMNAGNPFEEGPDDTLETGPLYEGNQNEGTSPEGDTKEDRFPLLYNLADDLKDLILAAAENRMVRGELIRGLQSLLSQAEYAALSAPQYRLAVKNLVEIEAKEHCGIHFDEYELNQLWKPESK